MTLHARGPYTDQRLLQAEAIELDWSLVRSLRNLSRRVMSMFGETPPEEPLHAIRVKRATLHVERLLSGRWNWQDAVSNEPVDGGQTARFRIPAFDAEGLRLVWVEHLPADSGGGLIEQKTASLFLDDVKLRFADVILPEDARTNATTFTMEGRTGDGRFSASGDVNFARWGPVPLALPGNGPGLQRAATSGTAFGWSPTFSLSLYLENFGAAAFTRLVSDASLMPAAGTMTGHIKLAVTPDGILNCDIDLQLVNVRYAANPRSSYVQARRTEVESGVKGLLINDHITKHCSVPWQEPELRVAKALQAEITGEAVHRAPAVVQGAAGFDRLRFVETADENTLTGFTSDLSARIGQAIGGERGAAVAKALTAEDSKGAGNPVGRGLRSVGRGFKRVFGGGKKKQ